MKNDREALAGYAAECWCVAQLGRHFGAPIVHEFGSKIDKLMKFDCCLCIEQTGDMLVDIKASISHPNCLLEADHPAFLESNLDGHRWFGFPFRDIAQIVLVKSTHAFLRFLNQDLVQKYETPSGKKHYIVKYQQITSSLDNRFEVMLVPTNQSFGRFFASSFQGDELNRLQTSDQIIQYVKEHVQPVCDNYDI